jgi:hypothetical protein
VQEYLDASRGKGAPLPDAIRKLFEAKFQRPLDDVRIHDDAGADDAAKKIDALAFTRGNDIYFRSAAYDPTSPGGKRLLAHELAHVIQQRPGINRKPAPGLGGAVIRRAGQSSGAQSSGAKKKAGNAPAGSISGNQINIAELPVPKFKVNIPAAQPKYTVRKQTRKEKPTKQASVWLSKAKAKVPGSVTESIKDLKQKPKAQSQEPYYLQLGDKNFYLIGTESSIANNIRIPTWDTAGMPHTFEIDHKVEAQLGGEDEKPADNLWLLDDKLNGYSGRMIMSSIDNTLHDFLHNTAPQLPGSPAIPSEAEVWDTNSKWEVNFEKLVGTGGPEKKEQDSWELDDLGSDKKKLLKDFKFVEEEQIASLKGSSTKLVIFGEKSGGKVREIPRKGDQWDVAGWKEGIFPITGVSFTEADVGQGTGRLQVTPFKDIQNPPLVSKPVPVPIKRLPGVDWGGVATPGAIEWWSRHFSPVSIPEPMFDVEKGIVGRGEIAKPSIKLLENVNFAVVLDGDVRIEATVLGGDLTLPGPFKVRGGSITLSAGLSGLGVTGDIQFEIEKLAKGHIGAGAGVGKGSPSLWLDGALDFDTKMFTKAHLGLSYRDGKWGVTGELAIGPDKIKGIKSASVKVDVKDDTVTADGEFETSIKGVEKGKLGFKYNEATGMEITGEVILGKGIPGIKSGKLDATIKEGPTGHSLSGGVTLEPSVPGLTGTVTGTYEDGAFLVQANLGYEKGLAKGSVMIGLTNQAVDPEGKPAGPPKKDGSLTVYGGGTVTLTLTPWLQGTVGLKLTPKGEIEVSGEVALPSTFEVFKERTIEKQLLSIGIDIPIIGVAVAGQRIGIFATIKGGVSISAGFGPGELRDVALKVTYNPDKPDDTTVTGRGNFVVPAHAGLRLSVDGGLGAGIPIVSATAGLTVFGEIGVAGAASAATVVSWSPSSGIVLDAHGDIFVEPKFKFGIEAFVDVSADLWITTIELYHQKWKLADFEYGSNLRFGLSLPIHYESGKPFDLSFEQIQWTYPHIEPSEILGGLMKQLVG